MVVSERTNLCPDHLCQGTNELWSDIAVPLEHLLVHHLANREPKGGLETLEKCCESGATCSLGVFAYLPDIFLGVAGHGGQLGLRGALMMPNWCSDYAAGIRFKTYVVQLSLMLFSRCS